MKWLLVALVMHAPVKTDLVFDSLGACLQAESAMRKEWTDVINRTVQWTNVNTTMTKEEKQKNIDFVMNQMTSGTCIPNGPP